MPSDDFALLPFSLSSQTLAEMFSVFTDFTQTSVLTSLSRSLFVKAEHQGLADLSVSPFTSLFHTVCFQYISPTLSVQYSYHRLNDTLEYMDIIVQN